MKKYKFVFAAVVCVVALGGLYQLWAATAGRNLSDRQQDHPNLHVQHAEVPTYPQVARVALLSGTVDVEVTVTEGKVSNVHVVSGTGVLAQETEKNIHSWRFAQSVNTTFSTRFIYKLDKGKPSYGQNPRVELELPFKATIISFPILGD